MKPLDHSGPNAEQIRYWNDEAGSRWVEMADRLDAHVGALGEAVMDAAELRPGERVLDVGCGCGSTSLALATRVGSAGRVLGVGLSSEMLALAERRAREAGATQLGFRLADAQTEAFEAGQFDLAFSRFGVMFFADPAAAFANLRRALAPGGRLAFACWQGLAANPWVKVPMAAIASHVELPAPPEPGEPGPFSLGDPERLRGLLQAGGFTEIQIEGLESSIVLGGGGAVDEAVDFLLRIGPAARALAGVEGETREAAVAAMRRALAAHETAEGVRLGAAIWSVRAA